MCYSCNSYNPPEVGNKNVYAYGEKYESLSHCGFIHANTKAQAEQCCRIGNEQWGEDNVILDYTKEECEQEIERRRNNK